MKESLESLGRIRTKGIALLVLTFVAGALAGVAVERLRSAQQAPELPPPDITMMRPPREGNLPPVFRQLNLTPAQREQIIQILERGRPRTDGILREMLPRLRATTDSIHAEVRAVLTPAQLATWDSLTAQMRRRAGQVRRGMRGRGMGPAAPPPPEP
jgi:Spy/CpxP family protein refolding chaperone